MLKNNILNKTVFVVALAGTALLASCSSDSLSEYERTCTSFFDHLGGKPGIKQWWRTAVDLKVNVTADDSTQLWLLSGEDSGTLYDYRKAAANQTVQLVMPQGRGNKAYIVSLTSNRNKSVNPLTLNGHTEQTIELNLKESTLYRTSSQQPLAAPQPLDASEDARATDRSALYGNSVAGNARHKEFSDEMTNEGLRQLATHYVEYVPARQLNMNCDYELRSKGDFDITWFAGNCLSYTPHILGYYYHTPGTYDDIKYVDLSETEVYDYIDGLPKVQYQVNEKAAAEFGVQANHWYDVNFDMGDTFVDPRPNKPQRKGDDAYSSIAVYNRYGENISAIRGITFTVHVPAGMHVGFYDRVDETPLPSQYDHLVKLGIKPYTSRDKFKAMNFTAEAFNLNLNQKGSYRSSIIKGDQAHWIGMENDYTGGDLDCNDVMFAISTDVEVLRPDIIVPDIEPSAYYNDRMPWTLAFEDVYRNADFDFNDAVVKLIPDYKNQRCQVLAMAAGSKNRMVLHYDGPDGDEELGELHELLGASTGDCVNTLAGEPDVPFVTINSVPWPSSYTMQKDARRFYIEVKRGTCHDCSDLLSLPDAAGEAMPQAILVAGEWKWPREGVPVTLAYPSFAKWAKDATDMDAWTWYKVPTQGKVVTY